MSNYLSFPLRVQNSRVYTIVTRFPAMSPILCGSYVFDFVFIVTEEMSMEKLWLR